MTSDTAMPKNKRIALYVYATALFLYQLPEIFSGNMFAVKWLGLPIGLYFVATGRRQWMLFWKCLAFLYVVSIASAFGGMIYVAVVIAAHHGSVPKEYFFALIKAFIINLPGAIILYKFAFGACSAGAILSFFPFIKPISKTRPLLLARVGGPFAIFLAIILHQYLTSKASGIVWIGLCGGIAITMFMELIQRISESGPEAPTTVKSIGQSRISRWIGRIGLATGIAGSAWLLLPFRVASPEINQIMSLLILWAVLIGFASAGACLPRRLWVRAVGALPFLLAAVLFPLSMVFSMIAGGPLVGYEVLDSVELPHSTVKAYRTNGGATTSYGIEIVQEMSVFPGIVLFKDLHHGYREYRATVKATRPGSILATINEKPVEYTVRPFVYF